VACNERSIRNLGCPQASLKVEVECCNPKERTFEELAGSQIIS